MFDRPYKITFVDANYAASDLNGESWDGFGGAPDPIAKLFVDGDLICQTSVDQDTFSPSWNESCEVTLFRTSAVIVAYYDSDVSDDDPAVSVEVDRLGERIRDGGISGSLSGGAVEEITVLISPK